MGSRAEQEPCCGQNVAVSSRHWPILILYAIISIHIWPFISAFVIKRKVRKTDRIYTPKRYMELILHSTVQSDKFNVKKVESEEVIDFKKCWPTLYKKYVMSSESHSRNVPRNKTTEVHCFNFFFLELVYFSEHVGQVMTRPFMAGLVEHTFHLKTDVRMDGRLTDETDGCEYSLTFDVRTDADGPPPSADIPEIIWSSAGMHKGEGGSPRKPADQRHRLARFPRAKIRELPRPEIELASPRWEARSLTAKPPRHPDRLDFNFHVPRTRTNFSPIYGKVRALRDCRLGDINPGSSYAMRGDTGPALISLAVPHTPVVALAVRLRASWSKAVNMLSQPMATETGRCEVAQHYSRYLCPRGHMLL
ncbi:hypothetical protein PR048_033546 [Dryococelus australis]|uniref:Uncharacterized protein n=1 Tax=Dryococelus australis TaxID=614101 RepID=A0ABQ9G3N0_9NEOP|nr:hypothetical protein PR048_033546 [Dryococelus australis]